MTTTLVDSEQIFSGISHYLASWHVQEGTNSSVLVPGVKPSAVVKTGALITVVITCSTCCLNQGLQARPYI